MSETNTTVSQINKTVFYTVGLICLTSLISFGMYLKAKGVEYEITASNNTIHPYNHCVQIIIAEGKKQGTILDVNKAHNICFGLQSGGEAKQKP